MRREEAAKGIAWTFLFTLINRAILPLYGLFLASRLKVDEYGVYAAVVSLFVIIELFRDAGIAITYNADQKMTPAREAAYVSVAVGNGLVLGLLAFVFRDPIAQLFNEPRIADALPVTALGLVVTGFGTISINRIYKKGRFRDQGLVETGSLVLSLGVGTVLVLSGYGFMGLVWMNLVRSVLQMAAAMILEPPAWARPDGSVLPEIWKQMLANLGNNLAYTVYTMGDYFVVTRVLGAEVTGRYAAAYNVALKPVELVSAPVTRTLFIALTRSQDDPERFARILLRSLRAAILACLPLFLLIATHPKASLYFLFFGNEDHLAAAPFLQVLVIYLLARALAIPAASALTAAHRAEVPLYCWAGAYVIAIPGLLLTVSQGWSLMGFVVSLTLGAVAVYSAMIAASFRIFRFDHTQVRLLTQSAAISMVSGLPAVGLALSPLDYRVSLLLATILSLGIHAVLTAKLLTGSPKDLRSKAGWKRLVEAV